MNSGSGCVLLLSNDRGFGSKVKAAARAAKCRLAAMADVAVARALLATEQFDLILVDDAVSGGAGLDVVRGIDLSRQGRVVVARAPLRARDACEPDTPAFEYVVKAVAPDTLVHLMEDASAHSPSREIPAAGDFGGMLGRTLRMQGLFEGIRRVAPLDVGVLVHAESGTGKELVAQALHLLSGRAGKFVAVNCGALSPELLSSQLFGHERGSFTGATQLHPGYFEQARGGTLFLDEITEMPTTLQVYLLRVIETHSLTRVGGCQEIPVDVRVIAASNRDLPRAVAAGDLRADLYFRLLEFPLAIPPLRERREDIPLLARNCLDRLNRKYGTAKRFATGALARLSERAWPGNVRELLHSVRRQYILAGDACLIEIQDDAGEMLDRRVADHPRPDGRARKLPATGATPASSDDAIHFRIGTTLEEIEREALLKTLDHFHNNKRAAARALGVSLKTVYNKLLRYRASGLIAEDVLGTPEDRGRAA